ncbi:hypothetical protein IB274_07535 [Pseudomonas sp. PDM18]|uniref:hypothetical protein n=1 Tax=Pseudomonas sp. PDM18 TaxID=2769253 RepID=UPI001784C0B3|nr:hypothetical protein [Pseudomonas sp. PDM18]MBD9676542.1 hypothetical protein [Pseudomonas sp. PDM18]
MAFSLFPDPLQLCRDAITRMENGINDFAARNMDSKEFSQFLARYTQVSLGVQFAMEKSLACVLERLDLPSRGEVSELAAAVQRVEEKLDLLLGENAMPALAPRPPRSRRPLTLEPEQALAEARARAKAAPHKTAPRPARRRPKQEQ